MEDLENFAIVLTCSTSLHTYFLVVNLSDSHHSMVTPTGNLALQELPQVFPVSFLESTVDYMLTKCCKIQPYKPGF